MIQPISIFDRNGLDQLRHEMRLDPRCVRNLRNNFLKRFQADEIALADFPGSNQITPHVLHIERRCDSTIDGATKLILRASGGLLIESVLLRLATGRTTLCVSSQVGCAAACEFCATGKMVAFFVCHWRPLKRR